MTRDHWFQILAGVGGILLGVVILIALDWRTWREIFRDWRRGGR